MSTTVGLVLNDNKGHTELRELIERLQKLEDFLLNIDRTYGNDVAIFSAKSQAEMFHEISNQLKEIVDRLE